MSRRKRFREWLRRLLKWGGLVFAGLACGVVAFVIFVMADAMPPVDQKALMVECLRQSAQGAQELSQEAVWLIRAIGLL